MMRFVAFDSVAAEDIVSDRFMQSVDYDAGKKLALLAQDKGKDDSISPRIAVARHSDGLFLQSASKPSPDSVVFDCEKSGLFDQKYSSAEVLLFIQKVLRFALKSWRSLSLSATERVLPNSSKAIIFPYPISQHTSFRISIEMSPDATRQNKRSSDGRSLLVYRSGTDEGGGPKEEAALTNFRRFLNARREIVSKTPKPSAPAGTADIVALSITALDALPGTKLSSFQGYEQWLLLLTRKQLSFVNSVLIAPHRIEGPAGTGKTLCLILKALTGLRAAKIADSLHKSLLITHSEATRQTVEQLIQTIDPISMEHSGGNKSRQTLRLATLQQLCGDLLRREISETEFLDRDAMESKQLQILYVEESLKAVMLEDYPTYKNVISEGFRNFLSITEQGTVAEMLQHEISVIIKGRADEQLDTYRELPRLKYGLPTETATDRGFVWRIFSRYQTHLQIVAQFDTDDIVLTTIGQLDTPIWRRRRDKEGYDSIYIDETHLFNINELSVFHHLTRSTTNYPIAYSVDRSQAIADRGWTDELFEEALSPDPDSLHTGARTEVQSIFRCSPDIVNLAFAVTSAGATLFTNFDDPLKLASSAITSDEERKCSPPLLVECSGDDEMIAEAFRKADGLKDALEITRSDVAIVAFTDELFKKAQEFTEKHHKPVELLKRRGDIEVKQRAQKSGRFILSTPDYIGGLEFDAVILIGVDDGRVPPTKGKDQSDSANFLSYASYNRLYVSITRARFRIQILISKERGPSLLLKGAIEQRLLLTE
jgi:hypothetical protein